MPNLDYFLKTLSRWAAITLSVSLLSFAATGTTQLQSVRNYLMAFSGLLLATMLTIDPELARARSRASPHNQERFITGLLFLATLVVGALDAGRLRWLGSVPIAVRMCGLWLFLLSGSLQLWAMLENPFFSAEIRIQSERNHRVITRGPYRFLRHPGYLAMLISIPATALAIGSWLALFPSAIFCLAILKRTRIEDTFLQSNLAGYREYMRMVPGRLLPHLRASFHEDLNDRTSIPG